MAAAALAVAACATSTDAEESKPKSVDSGATPIGAGRTVIGGTLGLDGGAELDDAASGLPGPLDGGGAPSGPMTVSGTLAYQGGTAGPAAGIEVRLHDTSGAGRFAVTDASGAFSFPDVVAPYDLHFVTPYDGNGEDYLGLRAATVALKTSDARGTGVGWSNNFFMPATVPATLPDCGAPTCTVTWGIEIPGQSFAFFATGGVGYPFTYNAAQPPATLTASNFQWTGPATVTGTARIVVSGETAAGTTYFYGETSATVTTTAGITLAAPLAPAAVSTNVIATTVERGTLPAAETVTLSATATLGGSTLAFPVPTAAMSATSISVPALPNGTLSLSASATGTAFGATTSSLSGALTVPSAMLTLLAPPEFTTPVTGATLADDAPIAWSGQTSGAVCVLNLGGATYSRTVYTGTGSVTLAQLLALDGTIPTSALTFTVSTFAPNAGVDDLATSGLPVSSPEMATGGTVTATRAPADAGADGG